MTDRCQETTRAGTRCSRNATYVAEIGSWCLQHSPCVCDDGDDFGEPHPSCPHHGDRRKALR